MAARSKHPEISRNLVLIGGRGCGKTSIAKRVALANRGFMLFSLDALIRYEAAGATVPDIVAERGWAGFRQLEYEVLEKLTQISRGLVMDCGGGIVVDLDDDGEEIFSERKVERLRADGVVIYLRRDPEYLAGRVAGDANRPDLSETKTFLEIMARREPWYQKAAHHVIECDGLPKIEIANQVLRIFYRDSGHDPSKLRLVPGDV